MDVAENSGATQFNVRPPEHQGDTITAHTFPFYKRTFATFSENFELNFTSCLQLQAYKFLLLHEYNLEFDALICLFVCLVYNRLACRCSVRVRNCTCAVYECVISHVVYECTTAVAQCMSYHVCYTIAQLG